MPVRRGPARRPLRAGRPRPGRGARLTMTVGSSPAVAACCCCRCTLGPAAISAVVRSFRSSVSASPLPELLLLTSVHPAPRQQLTSEILSLLIGTRCPEPFCSTLRHFEAHTLSDFAEACMVPWHFLTAAGCRCHCMRGACLTKS